MANYSFNEIVFFSKDEQIINDLYQKISEYWSEQDENDLTVHDFLLFMGYSKKVADNLTVYRNYFTNIDAPKKDADMFCFRINTESAWNPIIAPFEAILRDKYHRKIRLVYEAEEIGNYIYGNSDLEGRFLKDKFKMQYFNPQNDRYINKYFEDFDQLLDYIKANFPKVDIERYNSMCYIYDIEKQILKAYPDMDELSTSIYAFTPF